MAPVATGVPAAPRMPVPLIATNMDKRVNVRTKYDNTPWGTNIITGDTRTTESIRASWSSGEIQSDGRFPVVYSSIGQRKSQYQ